MHLFISEGLVSGACTKIGEGWNFLRQELAESAYLELKSCLPLCEIL